MPENGRKTGRKIVGKPTKSLPENTPEKYLKIV